MQTAFLIGWVLSSIVGVLSTGLLVKFLVDIKLYGNTPVGIVFAIFNPTLIFLVLAIIVIGSWGMAIGMFINWRVIQSQ